MTQMTTSSSLVQSQQKDINQVRQWKEKTSGAKPLDYLPAAVSDDEPEGKMATKEPLSGNKISKATKMLSWVVYSSFESDGKAIEKTKQSARADIKPEFKRFGGWHFLELKRAGIGRIPTS